MKTLTILTFSILFLIYCNAQVGTYTNLTAAQIVSNTQVQALIQAGLTRVLSLGQAKNQFNSTQFSVSGVNSVARQVVSGGNNYQIDVNYTNTKSEAVRAKYTGFYNDTSNKTSISTISYSVKYPRTNTTTNPPSTTTPPASTGGNNATNTTTVPVDQLLQDDFVNGLFEFGFNTTVQLGINNGSIPNAVYTVSKINSVTKQDVKNGGVYTFNVLATDAAAETNVALAFVVRGQLDAYNFKVQQ